MEMRFTFLLHACDAVALLTGTQAAQRGIIVNKRPATKSPN
jgi:hypothetical protein